MENYKYFNIIDYGSSKIRIAIFDSRVNICFSEAIQNSSNIDTNENFENLKNAIKKAEKKISSHIEDIILILDCRKTLIVDVSLHKTLDEKSEFFKTYNSLSQEINHLINNNYNQYKIIHTIFTKGIIDGKIFDSFPKDLKYVKEIKVHFKIICFPKKIILNIENNLNKNNLSIIKTFSTSYIKSLSYLKKLNLKKVCFLDIGFDRTSFFFYENDVLKYIQTIDVGSHHITKDIAEIFKITLEDAESIKKSFSKSETEFSYNNNNDKNNIVKKIINKNLSINLLKKVILYRVQEIIDLTFKKSENINFKFKDSELFLIGDGSILFNNNSFYLNDKFNFKSINYFNETDTQICNTGALYFLNHQDKLQIIRKKLGLFERFFNLFEK